MHSIIKKISFFLFFYLYVCSITAQENLPPVITSEGNAIYCPLTEQNIVTSFNIEDPDDSTLDALYIQISEGYVPGEDQLIYNGSNPDLNTTWSVSEGKLEIKSFDGNNLQIQDIINAVYEVVFISSNPNPSDKSFSFTIGDANYLPSTGHYYEFVEDLSIDWDEAKEDAEELNYYGLQGYLVTILSEEENQIAAEQITGVGWIGASDQEAEGVWKWVTGPEAGMNFWNGNFSGSAPAGMYSNWNNGEPNNVANGTEHYAHITDDSVGIIGSWNDLPNETQTSGVWQAKGYIVEYGGMPGDPELNLSSSTSLSAPPIITAEPFIGVDCNPVLLNANSNEGNGSVYWFEEENVGNSVFYGTSFDAGVLEAGNYSYWVSPFENGECDTFNRIEIQAFITAGFPEIITPNVTIDQECYTVEELVKDILINNSCANVSNITWSSGNDFGDVNGIAHFLEPSGGFPFGEGIILSTGDALLATGPNESMGGASSGDFGWPGDSDLDGLIEDTTENASIIEFDFVPISNKLSFRFIMASEEYDMGDYECNYSDVFAFLLTDENGVTTNLAVLPDTDIPIAITNIHPANIDCDDDGIVDAANPEYFHGYTPVGEPDIGYDGRTVPFTAEADVNIGETYHIKLAVADASDASLDSAVFLEAGSFDLGVNLGDDILIGSGNEECTGNNIILDTQIDDSLEGAIFNWYKDGAPLDDENSSTLSISETGTYSVDVIISDDCSTDDEILVEFYIPEEVENLPTLNSCDNFDIDGDGIFNLTTQNSNIISQLTSDAFTITYFESEEYAINDINTIENPNTYDNTIPFSQEIFTRIVPDSNPTCFSINSFFIETITPPEIEVPTPLFECDDDYDGIVDYFDLSQKTDEILNGQSGVIVSYHETIELAESGDDPIVSLYTNTTADNQTIHVRLEDNETGCATTTTLELIVNSIPEIIIPPILEVCDANYDGITTIDLSLLDATILDGQTGITVTYYETQEDAENAADALPTEYQNSNPNTQELVVRLEDDLTGCYSTTIQQIIVNLPGVIDVTDYELCDYTNPGDLTEVFNITTKDDEIIDGQDVSLSYFTSFNDSQDNINALSTAALTNYSNTNSASETIYIRLEQNATECLSFGSFNVTVNPLPNVIEDTNLVQCDIDDVQDGISIYNLEEAAENLVIGDDPNNYVLTFHLSPEDLEAGIGAIEDPTAYVNETPLQNIYCRVENINTTCFTTSYFYLETIFNPIPEDAGLIVCDNSEGNGNDYDGLGLFTLSDADEYVLSLIVANPNNDITDANQLTIAYYANEEDALLELNQLPNEYTSEVPDQQQVYLRVERDNDCFGINSMLLEVLPVPEYNEVPDEILCTDTPGVIEIDLNDYNAQVLGSQDPNLYIVTYHDSQLDADTGFNVLESPYTVNEQQIIYTRVEVDNSDPFTTGCFISNINFTLTVEPKPVFAAPTPLIVCDDDDIDGTTSIDISVKTEGIMAGIIENVVTYHETEEDMDAGINAIENTTNYTNTENPQTLYVRIEDDMTELTGCYSDTTLELIVQIPPPVSNPPALEYCDADADGFGVFNLTDSDAAIANGLPNLLISYHETQADAENNLFPIVEEYNNIVAYEQTIYIRVEDTTITTDCFSYIELLLLVNDVPQINSEPSSLEVCEDEIEDGFALFDLSLSNEEVLNGLDPSEFDITYYETPENAENAENPILTPFAYTNVTAFNQIVWVRVENNTTLCYNTSSIELTVNELPLLIQPDPLNLCDYNNPGDEVEEFTLEDSIGQVLQGQTGIEITFYETQEDADNATSPIVSPYANTSNAQTIYLRGENEITGCYSTITLDLRVNPIPSPAAPEPIEECDEDNDGFTFFTVEDNEVDIINGELDIVLSYYETTTNAENAIDPIISPYYNIVPDSQIIFVRAENIITGCFTIIEQELVTIPSPELPLIIEDIVVCDDDYDGITVFDLTQRDEDIFGEQITTDFGLTYHETLIDAETGENPIVNTTSYENLTNPQTIFVRLEDLNNGCVSVGEFNLIVALPPVIVQPTALEECDDEIADETTEFDLTLKDDEITAGNLDWEVIYYETQEDALAATNAIETPEAYTNTAVGDNAANPQTLFVAVINELGCAAYTTLTIRVLPNPTPNTDPLDLELCDYDNPGDEIEVFDISVNEAYIVNGEPGVSVAYYESLDNAVTETDPIVDPTNYTNTALGQQTIYVRVTNDITGCYTIVDFDVIVNVVPNIETVGNIIACEVDTDNLYEFDLDSITGELLGSQDPNNFTATYYESLVDAENDANAITSPYTNLTNPQELFVNITNDITGCFIIGGAFNIEVQEAALANEDGIPAILSICEDQVSLNDGITQFDLTELDEQILDGQDPVNFTVTYYATLEDADNGVNVLPTTYENTSNPQVIFARVDNDTTVDSQCYAIAEAKLEVNLLPEFTLEDLYTACVGVNGTELVEPTVMVIDLSADEHTFEWFDPNGDLVATTQSYTPLMSGTYTAVATSLVGCKYYVTTEVSGSSPAVVEAVVTTLAFAEEHIIEAVAVGTGDYEFSLDDGPWQLEGTFTDVSPGLHTVTVRDLNGCGIGVKTVLVIDYPRFFTPNGDGYNDTWQIIGIDTRPLSKIYIFDRYGKLLKELSPLSEGWDGTFNGKPLPATDYWFSVRYEEPGTEIIKTFRAHFSLKR